jgi:hypothetical protein
LTLLRTWYVSGTNYSRTLEDWLKLQDKNAKGWSQVGCMSLITHPATHWFTSSLYFCIVGLKELERSAIIKGKDVKEGTKAFHR